MFDMTKHSGLGYKLTIVYNAIVKKYFLTGYTAYLDTSPQSKYVKYSMDGASLEFDTLEAALKHITNYQEGD